MTAFRSLRLAPLFVLSASIGACSSSDGAPPPSSTDGAVVVDTSTPLARAQYEANVAFAEGYQPACTHAPKSTTPRVLVTGFGRFQGIADNATGRIVSRVVPGLAYPETKQAPDGEVDPPAPQTAVKVGRIELPGAGAVDACGMILPVYWDLAAILIAREIDAFEPDFVLMDGVADDVQPLWLELGSVNRAMRAEDGSNVLEPIAGENDQETPLVRSASQADTLKGLLLSYDPVQSAVAQAIARHKDEKDGDRAFGDVLQGVERAGFPRGGNTYLCNDVTYVTNYLMSYPGRSITLLEASTAPKGGIVTKVTHDTRKVPRVFVHWPSTLSGAHLDAAADVMRTILDTQLVQLRPGGAAPVVGSNAMAEIQPSGATF